MQTTPAILPHSFGEITEKLSRIEGLVSRVQIDICDGIFGREKTWYPQSATDTLPSGFEYEFDIMVNDWKKCVEDTLLYKPSFLVVHVDQFEESDIDTLVAMVKPLGIPLGIAVSNDKQVDFLVSLVRRAQEGYGYNKVYIQVMGIASVGEQSQPFSEDVVERIIAIKRLLGDVPLQVDGGMTPETALLVMKAGATIAVSGSYIFGDNDAQIAYNTMKNIGEVAGSYEE